MSITPTPAQQNQSFGNIWTSAVLTSVAISATINGIFLLLNEWRKRKSEEKRFKLEVALKLTELRHEQKKAWLDAAVRTQKGYRDKWAFPLVNFIYHFRRIEKLWKGKSLNEEELPTDIDMTDEE